MIKPSKGQAVSEVPKNVRELDAKLWVNISHTKQES